MTRQVGAQGDAVPPRAVSRAAAIMDALREVVSLAAQLVAAYRRDDPADVSRLDIALRTARVCLSDASEGFDASMTHVPAEMEDLLRQANALDREVKDLAFRWGTGARFGEQWLQNLFANMTHLASSGSCTSLRGAFQGAPAIIVAAGPSLNSNIHELRKTVGRGVILALNRTFAPLVRAGVRPDLVVALDSQEVVVKHLLDAQEAVPTLVARLSCHERVFTVPRDRTFVFVDTVPEAWLFARLGVQAPLVPSGGTVAQTAFSLATFMGCNPIILVGQDLAYTHGQSHAPQPDGESSPVDPPASPPQAPPSSGGWVDVPGYYGGTVRSTLALRSFINWYAATIPTLRAAGIRVINATEGGARIQGALQMPLAAAIDRYCTTELPITSRLDEAALPPVESPALFGLLDSWRDETAKALRATDRCKRAAATARKTQSVRAFARLDKAKKNALGAVQPLEPLVAHLAGPLSRATRVKAAEADTMYAALGTTEEFFDKLGTVLRRIASRLDEHASRRPDSNAPCNA